MFGFSVAVDDSTGTVLVGAVEHTQTWASWGDPGSTVGVKIGLGGKVRRGRRKPFPSASEAMTAAAPCATGTEYECGWRH